METKFFSFIKPYLYFIDNGDFFRKPFSWLYALIAILNLLSPIYVFYEASENRIFDSPAKYIFVFLFLWIIIAGTGWICFQLWWDRMSKISDSSNTGDEFVATPVFSHFIQTIGEWIGTYVGLVGFGFALFSTIFLGDEGRYLERGLGIPFLSSGWIAIVSMPIIGFLIVVISRFFSEQIRALSSIANNTKK